MVFLNNCEAYITTGKYDRFWQCTCPFNESVPHVFDYINKQNPNEAGLYQFLVWEYEDESEDILYCRSKSSVTYIYLKFTGGFYYWAKYFNYLKLSL